MFKVRQLSLIDHVIIELDKAITTVIGKPETTQRHVPGNEIEEATRITKAFSWSDAGKSLW